MAPVLSLIRADASFCTQVVTWMAMNPSGNHEHQVVLGRCANVHRRVVRAGTLAVTTMTLRDGTGDGQVTMFHKPEKTLQCKRGSVYEVKLANASIAPRNAKYNFTSSNHEVSIKEKYCDAVQLKEGDYPWLPLHSYMCVAAASLLCTSSILLLRCGSTFGVQVCAHLGSAEHGKRHASAFAGPSRCSLRGNHEQEWKAAISARCTPAQCLVHAPSVYAPSAACAPTLRARVGHAVFGADASNFYLPINVRAPSVEAIPCGVDDVMALEGRLRKGEDGCFCVETFKDDVEVLARHTVTLPLSLRQAPSPQPPTEPRAHCRTPGCTDECGASRSRGSARVLLAPDSLCGTAAS